MEFIKGYKRDPLSQVLINNDEKEYKDHMWKMDTSIKMKNMQNDIDMLKKIVIQLQAKIEEKN